MVIPAAVYLVVNYAWVKFALTFVRYEVGGATWNRVAVWSWENISFLPRSLPLLVGWAVLLAAMAAVALMLRDKRTRRFGSFWVFWLISCYVFHLTMPNNLEPRYFVAVLPSVCGLASCLLLLGVRRWYWRGLCVLAIVAVVSGNLLQWARLPRGFVGNDAVAERLSQLDEPGNILLSCWMDQDLIFRLRCHSQPYWRRLIRGDRSLAIRLPAYAGLNSRNLAKTPDDVLDVIRRGHIRYLLTCTPPNSNADYRPADMVLAHKTASSLPEQFELLDRLEIDDDIIESRRSQVWLWRFLGELPPGPSNIPVVIPTAGLSFYPEPSVKDASFR